MPLPPAVTLRRFTRHAVMVADNVGEVLETERTGVVLVGTPGRELNGGDRPDDQGIVSEREPAPLVCDSCSRDIGIPCEAAKSVKICLREVIAVPVRIQPDVRNADEA